MKALTYTAPGVFELTDKPVPEIINDNDAIVRVTLSSICTSDLHILHGSVPKARPGITVGHEMVGIVEKTGATVHNVKPGDPGYRSMSRPSAANVSSAATDGSTTAHRPTEDGRSDAASTAGRANT